MQIIPDANVLISILIRPGKTVELLFLDDLTLIAPALLFEELERNKSIIIQKSELTTEEIDLFINLLKKRIRSIPEQEFVTCREKAHQICPDEKDMPYFALALSLHCPIWSREKRLKEQNYIQIYATHELMDLFRISKI